MKKVVEIKHLIVQRRWFDNLKAACYERRRGRKMRTDANVFRFLKL